MVKEMKAERQKFLVVIAGPTAVGKTSLAIKLALHYNTEILSADSRQFYREMEIGTAKPTPGQLRQVKHHFINNRSVTELYGAGHFEKDAMTLLDELFSTYDLVIAVGGSGLYLEALLEGVDEFPEVPAEVREELNREFELSGLIPLQEELKRADRAYYDLVDIHNPQRVIRALEVIRHSGQTFSSFVNKPRLPRKFTAIKILVNTDRPQLYKQIETRVDEMMSLGLLEEVKALWEYKDFNALKTVGYKELFAHLQASYSLEEAVRLIKQHTRNFAKRQLTWFNNREGFVSFRPEETGAIINHIDRTMKK
jgi:tRNA dimethylallyltransferase